MKMNRREFLRGFGAFSASLGGLRAFAVEVPAVPVYYDSYLANIIAKVNRNRMERGCDEGFLFFTDPHVKSNFRQSGRLIARLVRETGIERVLCGGDLTEAFGEEYPADKDAVDFAIDAFRSDWVKPIRAAGGRLYCAKGNHDFTVRHSFKQEDGSKGFTYPGSVARKLIVDEWSEGDVVTNPDDPTACYYYFDVPAAKVRYVVADTTDTESAGDVGWGVRYGMHEAQLKWLEKVALGTLPKGYAVLAVQHIPVTDVAGSANDRKLFADYRHLLEACAAGGHLVVDFAGHCHGETQTWEKGVSHLSEPCDAAYRDYEYRSAFCGKLPVKARGTVYEQTFDIVQLSADRRILCVTRVGGGQDRIVHLDAVTVKTGETRTLEARMLDGVSDWIAFDGDTATARPNPENRWNPLWSYKNEFAEISSTGVLAARKPGISIVFARTAALDKEVFPVEIVERKEEPTC